MSNCQCQNEFNVKMNLFYTAQFHAEHLHCAPRRQHKKNL